VQGDKTRVIFDPMGTILTGRSLVRARRHAPGRGIDFSFLARRTQFLVQSSAAQRPLQQRPATGNSAAPREVASALVTRLERKRRYTCDEGEPTIVDNRRMSVEVITRNQPCHFVLVN